LFPHGRRQPSKAGDDQDRDPGEVDEQPSAPDLPPIGGPHRGHIVVLAARPHIDLGAHQETWSGFAAVVASRSSWMSFKKNTSDLLHPKG